MGEVVVPARGALCFLSVCHTMSCFSLSSRSYQCLRAPVPVFFFGAVRPSLGGFLLSSACEVSCVPCLIVCNRVFNNHPFTSARSQKGNDSLGCTSRQCSINTEWIWQTLVDRGRGPGVRTGAQCRQELRVHLRSMRVGLPGASPRLVSVHLGTCWVHNRSGCPSSMGAPLAVPSPSHPS